MNELIAYWMWEGLMGSVGRTLESKRKGKIILNELRHACMLENAAQNGEEYVKLHDLIRDMAIKIISTSPHCIVNSGTQLTKPPGSELRQDDVQRVSLMRNDLKSINFSPNCPKLTALFLQYNSFDDNITHDFFNNMHVLKVLDLSYTGISSLPESLSNLKTLHALLVSNCWKLSAVPSLANTSQLMVLDVSFSRITELPHGMEMLGNLRHLDISWTGIEFLPFGLVSKFTLLEDLLTVGSGVFWGSKAVKGIEGGASIEELISSPNLSVLSINFWKLKVYNEYVLSRHWCQLNKYTFLVGQRLLESSFNRASSLEKRSLILKGGSSLERKAALIPRSTTELQLYEVDYIKQLSTHLSDVVDLKIIVIEKCRSISCIVDCDENNLSMLERMDLVSLPNLKMICTKPVRAGTFMSLKIITVSLCNLLTSLFSWQLIPELKNIEEIHITSCVSMEDIIAMEEENMNKEIKSHAPKVIFPHLRRLKLYNMPVLKSIYNGDIFCNSLCSIEVLNCSALKRLPLGLFAVEDHQQHSSMPALQEIRGSEKWWESLHWDQPGAKHLLQPYFVKLDYDGVFNSWDPRRELRVMRRTRASSSNVTFVKVK